VLNHRAQPRATPWRSAAEPPDSSSDERRGIAHRRPEQKPARRDRYDTGKSNRSSRRFGNTPADHVRHVVDLPLHLREADEPDGIIDLQIEPADGSQTLIHLRGPAH
jgi:hypothetical protein